MNTDAVTFREALRTTALYFIVHAENPNDIEATLANALEPELLALMYGRDVEETEVAVKNALAEMLDELIEQREQERIRRQFQFKFPGKAVMVQLTVGNSYSVTVLLGGDAITYYGRPQADKKSRFELRVGVERTDVPKSLSVLV